MRPSELAFIPKVAQKHVSFSSSPFFSLLLTKFSYSVPREEYNLGRDRQPLCLPWKVDSIAISLSTNFTGNLSEHFRIFNFFFNYVK
jgi:hypothetical protein